MNMLFYIAFVATLAVTNGLLVQPPQVNVEDTSKCTTCHVAVDAVVKLLDDVDIKTKIVNIVKKEVCDILPADDKTKCNNYLDVYGIQTIDLLVSFLNGLDICSILC